MIKLSALNEESDEESGSEEEATREALEQIALQQYAKALDLQKQGSTLESLQILQDLLETELLDEIKKPEPGEKPAEPLFNLKYLCYKNVAVMQASSGEVEAAIESYCAAAELDDTDVTLWHRLGTLCYNSQRYEMALHAFQRGLECNPKHWPCIDKVVTLLMGLSYYEDCISAIHDALSLDPDYLRGIAYRKYIYTSFPYIKEFLEHIDSKYKYDEIPEDDYDVEKGVELIKEAEKISETYVEQQKAEEFKCVIPDLKLIRPIREYTWLALGESLVHMHHYMTEHCYSHACKIELVFKRESEVESMEVCEEIKKTENGESKSDETNIETEENGENISENEKNDSDKEKGSVVDTEKDEGEIESTINNQGEQTETPQSHPESKEQKKAPVRRRGSDLSFLQQWEWCNKRRSGRKKPISKEATSDNIYDTLRRMVRSCLVSEVIEKEDGQANGSSPDTSGLDKLFEEKDPSNTKEKYFETEEEEKDVEKFIVKFNEFQSDIIDILKEYLLILSSKWRLIWPESLPKIYVEANECYKTHTSIPNFMDSEKEGLANFVKVNLLAEEISLNESLNSDSSEKNTYDLSITETIGLTLTRNPHIFEDCLEFMLRYLWTKLHIHLINKNDEFTLDCLYQLTYEFEAMGELEDSYCLPIPNFTFKSVINKTEILAYIKFLERNKRLSTVTDLYESGHYQEVLTIVIDSYEHCKNMVRQQEEEMSLDFAIQLAMILDSYWALDKVEECFKWSLICLHESLKHYFHYTSGCSDHEKWSLTVLKILCSIEHILSTEGLACLDTVSRKELSQGIEDIIRVIGHQVETSASDMPLDSVAPWIIFHYILQREEDQGRAINPVESDGVSSDDIPIPLMVLFIGHEKIGTRGWCCKNDGRLLYFILDTVVPRLRSPLLQKSLELITQYMEQCVYCLFGHPGKKNKLKYLEDHNVTPHNLDWMRAQQVYEVFRPVTMPELQGKVTAITADTESLFHKILSLIPAEYDLQKYIPTLEKFMTGKENKLPMVTNPLPFKMRDIYFLLGDYYFKKEEGKLAIKYNMLDIILNNKRFESWAQVTLAKGVNLERMLNSCNNMNNEKDFLKPAKTIIRCFKHTLNLESNCDLWIEYGVFAYTVHSFCSRLLKQASESLSMEDFDSLEKQKEIMLETAEKCFSTVTQELKSNNDVDKVHEGMWLAFYMLGKAAEKTNKSPSVYIDQYLKSIKSLHEADAVYPNKINYNSPQHYSIEVMEMHYRLHASILKYIEQHENKEIPASIGKVFLMCIEQWKSGPFSRRVKKNVVESETESKPPEIAAIPQAANILKRSISDAGDDHEAQEAKKSKIEAAKVRRSASYDTERLATKPSEPIVSNGHNEETPVVSTAMEIDKPVEATIQTEISTSNKKEETKVDSEMKAPNNEEAASEKSITEKTDLDKKVESSSSTSSTSSSDSSSSETSSDSSSDSSRDSQASKKSEVKENQRNLTDEEIVAIIADCIEALEDCVSRFPLHYKALYRIAHYHFYYKKGKDIERCRDIMLTNFTSRNGVKMTGLFGERKSTNFFNNIWRIPVSEIDRAGGFANHMNRCVLITMEILKEIDDHKTLLEMSMQLQRIPEPDKKYLRDSDRDDLAQQAFSLCVQSLKGQLQKFSQQPDLKSNDVEKMAFNSLMLDIYRAYQKVQKQPSSKQFTSLLVEGFKLVTTLPLTENMNLVDLSMRYCQSLIQALKQQATMASLDKIQNTQKKQTTKVTEVTKPAQATTSSVPNTKPETTKAPPAVATSNLPKMSPQDMSSAFQSYLPMLNDPMLSQQAAAALSLSYLSNISALAGYTALQNTLQNSLQNTLQNSFQAEFYRQFLGQSLSSFNVPPPKKQKRSNKQSSSKSMSQGTTPPVSGIGSQMKSSAPVASLAAQLKSLTSPVTSTSVTSLASQMKSLSSSSALGSQMKSHGSSVPAIGAQIKSHSTMSNQSKGYPLSSTSMKAPSVSSLGAHKSSSVSALGSQMKAPSSTSVTTLSSQMKALSSTSVLSVSSQMKALSSTSILSVSSQMKAPSSTSVLSVSSQMKAPSSTSVLSVSSQMKAPSSTSVLSVSSQMKAPSSTSVLSVSSQMKASSSTSFSALSSQMKAASSTSQMKAPSTVASKGAKASTSSHVSQMQNFALGKQVGTLLSHSGQKSNAVPSMGTVLSTLPASLTATLTSSYSHIPPKSSYSSTHSSMPTQAHMSSTSTINTSHSKPLLPHQNVNPGKTLQEKLAERQKNIPNTSKSTAPVQKEINASIGRLPSSLTITKSKSYPNPMKKTELKKSLSVNEGERPKPVMVPDEVIVLDDD